MSNPYLDPNYNPYPRSVLVGTAVFFIILPIISVGVRFYARSVSWAKVGIDDLITIPSMLICIGLSITQIIATEAGGLGSHQELVDGQVAHTTQLYVYEKTKYTYQLLGTVGLWVIKLSVLLFFRRIFSVRSFRVINDVFIGITVAWGIAFTFTVALQCTPVSTLWEKFEIEYGDSCITVQPFYFSLAISDLILDVVIFILPVPHLWQLQLPWREKVGVAGIFLLGSIVVAIGITRTIIFGWVISFTTANPLVYFSDITWYTAGTLFWHLAENEVGLLGCCLPTYAPLFRGVLKKRTTLGASGGSSGLSSHKRSTHTAYHQRLEDEESLTRVGGSGQVTSAGFEEHALEAIPNNRIVVNTKIQAESSAA
ncbi:hypothetical protein GGS23DRAFT_586416 [Durotheca rogersii]|uniref:uncharacterized protein n=1 Tax=Durotheca rogersii TaxID=419775 RepID=UPI00221E64F6|nr:uncharacterized protein GGS23DRAFT_586416 [Durotheca rogersii]KAI5859277.1 hypothetical protein GGS23DRAFT_586416 [Durotheca rogersii]